MRIVLAALLACAGSGVLAQDAMPDPLTAVRGDAVRGRAIVVDRQLGMCLLCHSGPFTQEPLQGDLAPDLRGAGARLTEAQLRLRMVDSTRLNPATIMPPYGRSEGFWRVAPALRGQALLTPQQIEDVVAYLATLRD